MMFGEIVEPSTRALILEDDLEELPEYKPPVVEWEGNPTPPKSIDNLIFADSKKVVQICSKLTKRQQPVTKLINGGLSIFKFHANYLVVFDGSCKDLFIGEIVELLASWLKPAKSIHMLTSNLLTTFQPWESLGTTPLVTFTRCLTNQEQVLKNFCRRLESPNLVEGFGASIFSYCVHNNYKGSLWVVFTDNMPADSLNSAEIIRVLAMLGVEGKVDFKVDGLSSGNLYM